MLSKGVNLEGVNTVKTGTTDSISTVKGGTGEELGPLFPAVQGKQYKELFDGPWFTFRVK